VPERIRSDSPSVETVRATVARSGGTRRPEVRLPADRPDGLFPGDGSEAVVRVVLDGSEYHAPVANVSGTTALRGAYDNARRARERDGTDRLAEWIADRNLDFERSVLLDIVIPGEQYGLRAPGEEAVYAVRQGPANDLQDITRDLGDRS